jgi:hypothetical protein
MKTPEEMADNCFTIQDIRNWNPCYDPAMHLPENWSGTVADILQYQTIPPQDKIWVVCREELIDAKTLRLFAVWCARQIEHSMTDERSKKALEISERFAFDEATSKELAIAGAAAKAAVKAVAKAAVGDASCSAAKAAAWAAVGDASWAAAWAIAGAASWAAASAASWAADRAAPEVVARARAGAAARNAARAAQVAQLIKMKEKKNE